ncbi:GFA family protein [Thalassococcus sp. S3]|uniref:GFA family protein n=1 Tax=Thalassococcus sp. S3 TaxID=2017482 RepID=UPI001C2CC453|nr:GFA family protein [Thalassococcus sp. S3]
MGDSAMSLTGGCYCGAIRYEAEGDVVRRGQCHCRECQYISGGGANFFLLVPQDGFVFSKGAPARFARSDLAEPVTREFCFTCGTHLATRRTDTPFVILKAGTLDDPSVMEPVQMAIFTKDMQPYHLIGEDIPCFEELPPRR